MKARWIPFLLALAGVACITLVITLAPRDNPQPQSPLASFAASWQWVQFDQSISRGAWEQAYLHADRALALDPASPGGWTTLASHLIFLRGSAQNEPDGLKRVAWMQAGIQVLTEGIEKTRDPAELHLILGQTLTYYIEVLARSEESPLPWPGGAEAAHELGLHHFAQALALGGLRAEDMPKITSPPHDHPEGE